MNFYSSSLFDHGNYTRFEQEDQIRYLSAGTTPTPLALSKKARSNFEIESALSTLEE
jgi:hypothetical protein